MLSGLPLVAQLFIVTVLITALTMLSWGATIVRHRVPGRNVCPGDIAPPSFPPAPPMSPNEIANKEPGIDMVANPFALYFGAVLITCAFLFSISCGPAIVRENPFDLRSEEHTSELQSQSTISYAALCLTKKQDTPSSHV